MIIKIKIPRNNKQKWLMTRGHKPRKLASAAGVIKRLRNILPGIVAKEKIAVQVLSFENGKWENDNETLRSQNADYLIFVTACFLEDYISWQCLNGIEKATRKTRDNF